MLRGKSKYHSILNNFSFYNDKNLERNAEVANIPPTQVTKLGCFFLALGLVSLAGDGPGKDISRKFAEQMYNFIDPSFFKKYGFKEAHIKLYDKIEINKSFIKDVKKCVKKIVNDPAISTEEIGLLKFSTLFFENPTKNPNYMDRAKKYAIQVSSAYYRNFNKVVERTEGTSNGSANKSNIKQLHDELADVVGQITGKTPKFNVLSVDNPTIQKMRLSSNKTKAELAKQYKNLRRQIVLAYDMELASYLSSQPNNIVYVDEAYKHMEDVGFRIHKLPTVTKRIPLKVGLDLGKPKYYTDDNKPLNNTVPSTAKDIKFAKTYNKLDGTGAYLTYTSDMAQGVTRVYTEMHAAHSAKKISSQAYSVSTNMEAVLNRWKRDLLSADPIKMMGATAAAMIYLTAMRVGARQNSAASTTGVPTYGAISLRPRHITIRGTNIIIKYKGKSSGKSGVEQKHVIKVVASDPLVKRLASNLGKLLENKKGDTLVFSIPNTNKKKKDIVLSYDKFNKYLKASGYPAGIHKIRRVRGTNLMLDLLRTNKFVVKGKANTLARAQKEAETFVIDKILIPIANLLGHKSGTGADLWRTTAKSYIEPEPLIRWFYDRDLRIPKWLPKKASE